MTLGVPLFGCQTVMLLKHHGDLALNNTHSLTTVNTVWLKMYNMHFISLPNYKKFVINVSHTWTFYLYIDPFHTTASSALHISRIINICVVIAFIFRLFFLYVLSVYAPCGPKIGFNKMLSYLILSYPDLRSITFKCNRLHYNYFAIFMITLHYDYINFQM